MTARTVPAPLAPPAVASAAPARRRTYLSARVRLAFGAIGVPLLLLAGLGLAQLRGTAALAAGVLGGLALLATLLTARWLLRDLVGPLGGLTLAVQPWAKAA